MFLIEHNFSSVYASVIVPVDEISDYSIRNFGIIWFLGFHGKDDGSRTSKWALGSGSESLNLPVRVYTPLTWTRHLLTDFANTPMRKKCHKRRAL